MAGVVDDGHACSLRRPEQLWADPRGDGDARLRTVPHPLEGFVRFVRKEMRSMTSCYLDSRKSGPTNIGGCDLAPSGIPLRQVRGSAS